MRLVQVTGAQFWKMDEGYFIHKAIFCFIYLDGCCDRDIPHDASRNGYENKEIGRVQ
jgi:hypothetical protein